MIELHDLVAELSAILDRIASPTIEAVVPETEPEAVDEFPEIEGVILI